MITWHHGVNRNIMTPLNGKLQSYIDYLYKIIDINMKLFNVNTSKITYLIKVHKIFICKCIIDI